MSPRTPSEAPVLPTLLLYADISGYTRYVRDNPYTAAHALDNINTLLDTVVDSLEPQWQLSKLEGDAAFCHAPAQRPAAGNRNMATQLQEAFGAFATRKAALCAANTCRCLACNSLDTLELKVLLHEGEVLHYSARSGNELGGLPVILLHRLAKNGVKAARYILWTDAVSVGLDDLQPATRRIEHCADLGPVQVQVCTSLPGAAPVPQAGLCARLLDMLRKTLSWLPLNLRRVPGKAEAFDAGGNAGRKD